MTAVRRHPVLRRTVFTGSLGVAAAAVLGGCTESTPVAPPPDPDRLILEAALGRERALFELTDGWRYRGSLIPPTTAAAVVGAHVTALTQALGSTPAPTSVPATPPDDLPTSTTELATAATAAAREHQQALLASGARTAQLLASVAASDAALARAVRRPS